jgi:hypothetical protein
MVKPTSGFLSDDGNFFKTEAEAEFHEAETALMMALGSNHISGPAIDGHMVLCVTHKHAIRRYLNAYEAVNQKSDDGKAAEEVERAELERLLAGYPETGGHTQDDAAGAERDAAVQPFARDGHSDVSDVGSGSHTEAVQDNKA